MRHERVDDIVEVDEAEGVLHVVTKIRGSEHRALTHLRERVADGARRREDEHVLRGRDALGATLVAVLQEVLEFGPEEKFADTTHIGDPRRWTLVVGVRHGLMHRPAPPARPHGVGEVVWKARFDEVSCRCYCHEGNRECQHANLRLEQHVVSEQRREMFDSQSARHPHGGGSKKERE